MEQRAAEAQAVQALEEEKEEAQEVEPITDQRLRQFQGQLYTPGDPRNDDAEIDISDQQA